MPTVLVIDADEATHFALELVLNGQGCKVLSAHSPEGGIRALEANVVDVVVHDLCFRHRDLCGSEGVQLFQRIHETYPSTPIIVLTALDSSSTEKQLLCSGAITYLRKPWDNAELLAAVHAAARHPHKEPRE